MKQIFTKLLSMIPPQQANSRYDHLQIISNEPKLSTETMITQKRPETTREIRECRICLQNSSQSPDKAFISPCQCCGSVKYVHEDCITEWLLSCYKKKSLRESVKARKDGIQCQMCKAKIKFDVESRWGCNSCAELCEIVKDKKYLFIVIIILFLISSGGAGFALYSLIGGDAKLSENNTNLRIEVILALCGAFLMFMFLIIAMYTLVMDFLVKYERLITRVGQGHISPNQIYPEDPSQLQIEDIE